MEKNSMDYIKINKEAWNKRTDAHLEGQFYAIDDFKAGKTSLKQIELALLGDVQNKKILHLQCHFGQDSLSLARMGATVTGVDLSDRAILAAQSLNKELDLDARFICSAIDELANYLDEKFDMVYATYGVVGWHPELTNWFKIAASYLHPGGQLVLAEFHPMVWMFDENFDQIIYDYFNTQTFHEQIGYSYGSDSQFIDAMDISWNHPISDVLNAMIGSGFSIGQFNEYNFSPYDLWKDTTEVNPGQFYPTQYGGKVPLVYSVLGNVIA